MMLSPETYYELYLKDKTEQELITIIRELKNKISYLKNILEHPDYQPKFYPSELVQLKCTKLYLARAKQALEELGGSYEASEKELKAEEFKHNLPYVHEIKFMIGGFFSGYNYKTFTIHEDKVHISTYELLKEKNNEAYFNDKHYFLEELKLLDIGEWDNEYSSDKYGIFICDGMEWELEFNFSNGYKTKKYSGINAYPYNFDDLLQLLNEECLEGEIKMNYTIDKETKDHLISQMICKLKELPSGTEICTSELLKIISKQVVYSNGGSIYDGILLENIDMMSLNRELKIMAKKSGLIIDDSIHEDEVLGLPYHIGFVVR